MKQCMCIFFKVIYTQVKVQNDVNQNVYSCFLRRCFICNFYILLFKTKFLTLSAIIKLHICNQRNMNLTLYKNIKDNLREHCKTKILLNCFLEKLSQRENSYLISFASSTGLHFFRLLCKRKQQCLDREALSAKYQVGRTIGGIFFATVLTITQISSHSWKPERAVHTQQKGASCFTTWDKV